MFPPSWYAAGLVSAESAADFTRYAAAAPDVSARAWRWAAARDWAEERAHLTADECRTLFALGAADPDANLGTALMCAALYQRGCPADVRAAAAAHPRLAVRRTARLVAGERPA
ncbi:hypothetical protein [Urbifossiella limnaea]|uniref:Uncharacterized protein n=1 Tax=Urbifossiella limnaea TaxID=2528023 RepID=A0A517XLJ5_9BACT|nr:hypothetical protein [Urbifossiella limnaea]QDU18381.1 hypothetical protein ETAA1_02670 [Urbifossiella limnaea]